MRERFTNPIKVKLTPSMKKAFIEACDIEGVDMSGVIRTWIQRFINKKRGK